MLTVEEKSRRKYIASITIGLADFLVSKDLTVEEIAEILVNLTESLFTAMVEVRDETEEENGKRA